MSRSGFYRLVSGAVAYTLVNHVKTAGQREGVALLANELAVAFGETNTKFDAALFRRNCGL